MFGAAMLYHVTRVTRLHNIWECLLDLKFCARMATTGKELHKHHLALNWWRGIEFLCVYRAPQCCLVHARIWLFPNFSSSFSRPPAPFPSAQRWEFFVQSDCNFLSWSMANSCVLFWIQNDFYSFRQRTNKLSFSRCDVRWLLITLPLYDYAHKML